MKLNRYSFLGRCNLLKHVVKCGKKINGKWVNGPKQLYYRIELYRLELSDPKYYKDDLPF